MSLFFIIVAIVCFVLAGFSVAISRANLTAIGLAFFAASFLPLPV